MAAIAGIALPGAEEKVEKILEKMAYRGEKGSLVKTVGKVTLGVRWPAGQPEAGEALSKNKMVEDAVSDSHYARAKVKNGALTLTRDPLGASPLYYGQTEEGALCFSSEVKGLVEVVSEVYELKPGSTLEDGNSETYYTLTREEPVTDTRQAIASELRLRLVAAVKKRANRGVPFGAWLSGGLDSSAMAALARPFTKTLHTFAAGFDGAEDLDYARAVARFIQSKHHEVIPTLKEVIKIIPDVIYHLESFDALLVRSSVMNFLVAKAASDYVPAVFSGEGGDELFAGYDYLKKLSPDELRDELLDITARLHNTALQRVDRCASAHGTVAYLGFLDEDVVDYALHIPAEFMIFNGMEKWPLRRAVYDLLPERVVTRTKAKFWQGAGVQDIIARYTEERISDEDFRKERKLPDGSTLNSKEELYYYRIFQEKFGEQKDLGWMGRTKGSPTSWV